MSSNEQVNVHSDSKSPLSSQAAQARSSRLRASHREGII
jgi:hypothetical protein